VVTETAEGAAGKRLLTVTRTPSRRLTDHSVPASEVWPDAAWLRDQPRQVEGPADVPDLVDRSYVGVTPRWVLQRGRLHLAADLGYADQAHFIRDFRRVLVETPARYAEFLSDASGQAGRVDETGQAG
jgi:hypothetical protein